MNNVLDYLAGLFDSGLSYRTINVARSTLSSTLQHIDGVAVGCHPLVVRLMKGVFNSRPPVKKTFPSWSVSKVIETLKAWSPAGSLSLRCLTLKTVMLLALATGKRVSSLYLLSIKKGYIQFSDSKVVLQFDGLEKHSRPEFSGAPVVLQSFNEDPRICPVFYLRYYLKKTKDIRKSDRLFVCVNAPHSAPKPATLSSWLRKVITQSGQAGSGGSVRSLASSRAFALGVSLSDIVRVL